MSFGRDGVWHNGECIASREATDNKWGGGLLSVNCLGLKSLKGILRLENISTVVVF